jgi:uncharacterized protein YdhG (YjbR/CyaY superfamily)
MQPHAGSGSIDEYIAGCPEHFQEKLKTIRNLVRSIAPEAAEKIAYGMPTFFLNGNLVHFAAHTHHIGFYPTPSGVSKFKRELSKFDGAKGSVQFPIGEPLPVELIKKIVMFRVEENRAKAKRGGVRKG